MQHSSWKKCDLQVATPAWKFKLPSGSSYDFSQQVDRQSFLDLYMQELRSKGIDVVALADHNTGEWIDAAKEAGARHGIVVFPGCEVTTSSGSDGVHLLIIGDLSKTSQDFDRLLESVLGFTGRPRFNDVGSRREPASSSKTVDQILDDLPDGYLAIAPHVFSENGLASEDTVQGDIRWRCLHHPKLSAVDPGDCSVIDSHSFRHRFCRRELAHFPCLESLPFVATSDAYSLDDLGGRFTWIRMGTPSLEALRQAFLDYEARILCDWDERLAKFPERNPNNIRHAWIEKVDLGGTLGNSSNGLSLSLHPNLNVIIGGRGSGKSTIVAAIRALYGSAQELPERIREEVDSFRSAVFDGAQLRSSNRLQESQDQQQVSWTAATGSLVNGTSVPTDFPVRVFSQKELYERAAGDKKDPFLASRSLLALLDQSLNLDGQEIGSLPRQIDAAKIEWSSAARSHAELVADLHRLPSLQERARTLRSQVDAFSSPEVKEKLARIHAVQKRQKTLAHSRQDLADLLGRIESLIIHASAAVAPSDDPDAPAPFLSSLNDLNTIRSAISGGLHGVAAGVRASLSEWDESAQVQDWNALVAQSEGELQDYIEGLESQGLSQDAFTRLSQELAQTEANLQLLLQREAQAEESIRAVDNAWSTLLAHLSSVREQRVHLLTEIQARSEQLRFKTEEFMDQTAWVDEIRELMSLRADGYVPEVIALAGWLWAEPSLRNQRWSDWRQALASGDFAVVRDQTSIRSTFFERLVRVDETIRLRLATEIPGDVVHMEFLKSDGDPATDSDWQSITEGSPGQRTAAMLAFVLHHGSEPLVIDQPEDDLDSEWIAKLVVESLRTSRWSRQLVVVTHNANIPVLADADQVIALENRQGTLRIRSTAADDGTHQHHIGPVESELVRVDIQKIMEGGIDAFLKRERRYNAETLAARKLKK